MNGYRNLFPHVTFIVRDILHLPAHYSRKRIPAQ